MFHPLQLTEHIVIGPSVPPRLTHSPCTWTTAKAQLFPKAKEHSCCCDQNCVSFHTLHCAFKVWKYLKTKQSSAFDMSVNPHYTLITSMAKLLTLNWWFALQKIEVSLKNQNLFWFLNARICWCTGRACLAQSALFSLSSKWLSKSTVRDTAQVSVCRAQPYKGHQLEPPGLALEGLSKPQHTAGLQSL